MCLKDSLLPAAMLAASVVGAVCWPAGSAQAVDWYFLGGSEPQESSWQPVHTDDRHGYRVNNEAGDFVLLSCDPDAPGDGWIISLAIDDAPPPPEEPVTFLIANTQITFRSALDGQIHLDDAIHADPYYWLWNMLRQGKSLSVTLPDFRSAHFNLAGARTTLSDGLCSPLARR